MARRFALALLVSLFALSGGARAAWEANVKAERFRWAESTQPSVTETGPRFGIGAAWTQDRERGLLFGWRGELYGGSVHYSGAELFPPNRPISGTTEYTGVINELQATYRSAGGGAALIAGLGLDYWNRQLTDIQKEEWWVTFARLGGEFGNRTREGFFAGAGVKYPVYIAEDAHLTDIGFDQNPTLHPGREASLYGEAGYRFARRWTLSAYYDSYRFKESPGERVTRGGSTFIVFQPRSVVDTYGLRLHLHF
ncbi:MAG: hypothetical protein QOD26_2682 [Betaproteobacteria bacterium]|nr:hypothetical protein [Betaproteobacteria bacterium]